MPTGSPAAVRLAKERGCARRRPRAGIIRARESCRSPAARSQLLRPRRHPLPAPGHRMGPGLDEAGRALRDRARIRAAHDGLAALRRAVQRRRTGTRCSWAWARPRSPSSAASKLRMKTTAIELNPQVVAACRGWFKLPADDAKLSVILGDAARRCRKRTGAARSTRCRSTCTTTRRPRRCSTARTSTAIAARLLTEDGCMTVNLFGRSSSYERSLEKIVSRLRRRGGVGLQADARRQHRGAGAAHAEPSDACRACRPRTNASRLAGPCPRPSGCGCSNPRVHECQRPRSLSVRPTPPHRYPPPPAMRARSSCAALIEWLAQDGVISPERGAAHHRALRPGREPPAARWCGWPTSR